LIGGQACIIYGAAEFSRDSDFVVLSMEENLDRLQKALKHLQAETIYFPPFETEYLERGHACHFCCGIKDIENLRIDVLTKLRGCDEFDKLWSRRKTVKIKNNRSIDIISLQDLVRSKKTQRDKDWLMLKRLVENDMVLNKANPADNQIKWWLRECRNADILIGLAEKYPEKTKEIIIDRPLLSLAAKPNRQELAVELQKEEMIERRKDIEYWEPLKKELESMRHGRGKQ